MIITIDTAKDSPEEIEKLITFLSHIAGKSYALQNQLPVSEITPETTNAFSQLFDTPETSLVQPLTTEPGLPATNPQPQAPESKPKVMVYGW